MRRRWLTGKHFKRRNLKIKHLNIYIWRDLFVSVPEHPQSLLEIQTFILVCKTRCHFSVITVGVAVDLAYGFGCPLKFEKLTPTTC